MMMTSASELKQIRKLKARMEAERLPRGVRRERHLKLGKGGLSDVEWTIQLLQLQHAHNDPDLRVNSTTAAFDAVEEAVGDFSGAAHHGEDVVFESLAVVRVWWA